MKAIKRTVAALLATLMLATSTSFTLAAEADVDDLAIAKVNAAGIMTGTDKGFEPSKSLTRAEAAAIIVRMKGISEATVKAAAGTTNFDDVAATHWAAGYINQASNLGIVKGVSATSFAPDKEVTVQEMVTMAVRALGAGTLVDSEGIWPTNYINFAAEEGLLDGVAGAYAAVSTRLDAARVVANSLEANMWVKAEADTNSKITYKISGDTILNDVLKIDYQKGMTVDNVKTKDRNIVLATTDWAKKDVTDYTSKASIEDYDVTENVNLAVIKTGDEVDVWFKTKSKEVVGVWAAENTKQTKIAFTEIVKDTEQNKVTLKVNGKEKKYNIVKDAKINYNGEAKDAFDEDDTLATQDWDPATNGNQNYKNKACVFGTATIVGGEITALYLEEYTNFGIVKELKKDKVYYEDDVVGDTTCEKFDFSDDNDTDEFVITKDGKEVKVLEAEDAIEYYVSGSNKYVINVLTNTVDGKVTSISDDNSLKIAGTSYSYAKTFALSSTPEFKAGDEVTIYLNENGKIVMAKVDEEAMDSTLGIITYARAKEDDYGEVTYELKVTGFDNIETDVVKLDKVKFYDKLGAKLSLDSATTSTLKKAAVDEYFWNDTTSKATAAFNALLGQVVRFNVSSEKVTIAEMFDGSDVVSAYDEATIVELSGSDKVNSDRNKIGSYIVTDSTVIFVVKSGDEDYEKEVTTVDFDDLEHNSDFTGFVVDVNKETNKAKYFVTTDSVEKDTDNYAVVKSVTTSYEEDDEAILTLFTADGVKEIVCDADEITADVVKGAVVKYNKGDKITDLDVTKVADVTALEVKYVVSFNEDNIKFVTSKSTSATPAFMDCEEDLIVLSYESIDTTNHVFKDLKASDKMPEVGDIEAAMDGASDVIFLTKTVDGEDVVYGLIFKK